MKTVTALAVCVLIACSLASCTRGRSVAQAEASAMLDNPGSSSDGGRIYVTNCSSCHQLDGKGVAGVFPALAGSPAVTGDPRRTIAIVKFGLRSPTAEPAGGVMPAWNGLLSDQSIADVVTYIRFAWHNAASPVSAGQVRVMASPSSGAP